MKDLANLVAFATAADSHGMAQRVMGFDVPELGASIGPAPALNKTFDI